MFSKNDLNLLKLAVNFARESIDNKVGTFEEYVKNNLENESSLSLEWKLGELSDRLNEVKLEDIESKEDYDTNYDELNILDNKRDDKLKSNIVSILSQMIEDGELGLYKHSDYDGEYVGISIDNGDEIITPRYSFCGPIKLY